MTAKLVTRAILITAIAYVTAIAAFMFLGASRDVSLFLGGSTALMALALLMLTRGVLEAMNPDRGVNEGGLFRYCSDAFMVLTPGEMGAAGKALIAAAIIYFTKMVVFGDAMLGMPPLWLMLMGA